MELLVAIILIMLIVAVLAGAVVSFIRHGTMRGSGLSSTTYMGASYEMLSQDQRKAAEVIVEDRGGSKREDDESGETVDTSFEEL